MPSVGALGEDALVAGVIAGLRAVTAPAWLTVGPGDDAAVIDLSLLSAGGSLVTSTDTLVEGEDFRLDWSGGADVGVKVAAQNFADLAAMGAVPAALLVSLALPGTADARWAAELADGLGRECARAGAAVVGGDVSAAREIVITGTALGVLPAGQAAVLRSGARPGDVVAIAGQTGRSAAGLALLQRGYRVSTEASTEVTGLASSEVVRALIVSHQRPQPPYSSGPAAAAAGARALIDTSDGLVRDAGRIAAASAVVLDLDAAALAPSAELIAAARLLQVPEDEAVGWVMSGGEDHALLACFGPGTALPDGFRRIGQVLAPDAVNATGARHAAGAVLVNGRAWAGNGGWHHFRPS